MLTAIPSLVGFPKAPWNKGRLIGQKRPLKLKEVWAIRVRLQLERWRRDLALFARQRSRHTSGAPAREARPTLSPEEPLVTVLPE